MTHKVSSLVHDGITNKNNLQSKLKLGFLNQIFSVQQNADSFI